MSCLNYLSKFTMEFEIIEIVVLCNTNDHISSYVLLWGIFVF